MARQEGRVQLEQSYMLQELSMAKRAKGGFSHTAEEEMRSLTRSPCAEVSAEKKPAVGFPGQRKAKAAIDRHPAMLRQNHTDRWLPGQPGTTKNLQTRWRRKATGAPPPDRHRQPIPEPTEPLPAMPPVPPGANESAHISHSHNLPPGYVYSHASLPSTQFSNPDAYAQDSQHDNDYNPDMLTDDVPSTGYYTICCVVMQLTFILQTRAAFWVNLQVRMSIDWKERDIWVYCYLQLADTVKCIVKVIFICIIKEQCSDEAESKWRC